MADNDDGSEAPPRGNEWEVVSLTASAYDAAPGPKEVELNDDNRSYSSVVDKGETSDAMFMSGHFVFPPSQHENLPLEPEKTVVHDKQEDEVGIPEFVVEEGGRSSTKDEENWDVKDINMSDDFPQIQFVDKKGKKLSVSSTEFEEGMALQGLNLLDQEQTIYNTLQYSSVHGEATIGGESTNFENRSFADDLSEEEKSDDHDEDNHDGSHLPCEAWWKKRAASFCAQAKEANAVWSIFVAAAVVGLVILGHRWHQQRWQALQQRSQLNIK